MKRSACLFVLWLALLPSAAWAQGSSCAPGNEVAIKGHITQLVSALRIANYRADVLLMEKSFKELDGLLKSTGCASMAPLLCDAECAYQLANVQLFRATGYPLMRETSNAWFPSDPPGGNGEVRDPYEAQAMQGVQRVEQALKNLARQQQAAGSTSNPMDLPLNRFLKAHARLNSLKARLFVAAGDIWYRKASFSRLDNLQYQVAETLGEDDRAKKKGTEYYNAATYYDQAFWVILEARSSLPAANADLFGSELSTLTSLESDVNTRLDSVRKGYLYLNIDPEQLTGNSLAALSRQLVGQREAIRRQEGELRQQMDTWAAKFTTHTNQQLDLANQQNSRVLDLEVYKLAQMQATAGRLTQELRAQVELIDRSMPKFQLEQRIKAIEATLAREQLELSHQLQSIKTQTEQDLLGLEKEAINARLDDLRFSIDMTMAEYNFAMQVEALLAQKEELDRQFLADKAELDILEARKGQVQKGIEAAQWRIDLTEILVDKYKTAQETSFKSARIPIVEQICAVDAELVFYSRSPAYSGYSDPVSGHSCTVSPPSTNQEANLEEICKARDTLKKDQLANIQKIRDCINGASCSNMTGTEKSVVEAINKLSAANQAVINQRKAALEKTKLVIKEKEAELRKATNSTRGIEAVKGVIDGLWAAATVLAAVPDGETGMIGLFPVKTLRLAEAAAQAARTRAEALTNLTNFAYQVAQYHHQLESEELVNKQELLDIANQIEAVEKELDVEKWSKQRELAEISVRLTELQGEYDNVKNEQEVQRLECDGEMANRETTVAKLLRSRAGLVGQLQQNTDDSALTLFDIHEQENLRAQAQTEIERLNLEMLEYNRQQEKVRLDQQKLTGMKAAIDRQISTARGYQSSVKSLQGEYSDTKTLLKAINEKLKDSIVLREQKEREFVSAVLAQSGKVAFSEIADLKSKLAQLDDADQLVAQVHALEQKLAVEVEGSYKNILAIVRKNIEAGGGQSETANSLFWDFENLAAELSRGAGDMLDYKRRLLENANFTYNLYRSRYNVLAQFAGDVAPISEEYAFISNAMELERVLADCSGLDTNEICKPRSLVWDSKNMTGTVAEFTLENTSTLLQQLLAEGRVRFEISPYGQSLANSQRLGNLVLWHENLMNTESPMLLVHVMALADGSSCGSKAVVRHLGSGTLFSPMSRDNAAPQASLVVRKPTDLEMPVWTNAELGLWTARSDTFRSGSFTAAGLETVLQSDRVGKLEYPLVGLPLIGTYELIATPSFVGCLSGSSTSKLKLGFIYVVK
ncbi:hypothetical protein JRI60_24875 [Archangium violaceum]|uniref:hypothetical protein n=1 Tax=Archangium violaceum TaxID=83451 RepID=UPI0019503BFD|nr:hypothetical protein [Archangium violaceum]QRO02017.1 hypothetical protein JRI60_24875 [Archangium violaceum]